MAVIVGTKQFYKQPILLVGSGCVLHAGENKQLAFVACISVLVCLNIFIVENEITSVLNLSECKTK